MKIITGISLLMLILSSAVCAQDGPGPDEYPPQEGYGYGPDGGPRPGEGREPGPPPDGHGRRFGEKGMRGPGGREGRLQVKQFRQEVRDLGDEIRANELMIQGLEEEIETMEPGVPRAEVRKKLNECRLREAELQIILANKRVDFTRRARDHAQKRYEKACQGMEKVEEKIKNDFPELADQLAPEMNPEDEPPPPEY